MTAATEAVPIQFEGGLVLIVDDDMSVRQSLQLLVESSGLKTQAFSSADEFLGTDVPLEPSCLLLDVRLPGTDGLILQSELKARGWDIPIVFMTGHATVPMTVKAMRAGAIEFLCKPLDDVILLEAVTAALKQDSETRLARSELEHLYSRYRSLTAREGEVFLLAIGGLMNKQIAAELGTTEITAKVHKRRVMEKMEARSLTDLVGMAVQLDLKPSRTR
ncbi:response regulator transcription factor [Agrobacterium vitis]|uniref:response regulator transcription factor n=1 Tax=Agrobacterium vitis TaxID=373 RepID=UPI0008722FC3|nr:response regulator [Agrobacterium vitis]